MTAVGASIPFASEAANEVVLVHMYQVSIKSLVTVEASASRAGEAPPLGDTLEGPEIWDRIQETYSSAREKGAASTTDTDTELLVDEQSNICFVLRVATALLDKPKPQKTRYITYRSLHACTHC